MALVLNTYKDYEMKTIDKQYGIGIAGITGYYASQNNWIRYSYQSEQGDVFFVNPSAANFAGIVLSGGNSIFDYSFRSTIPFQDTVPTDKLSNTNAALIYNPTLIGKGENHAYFLQMWCSQNSDTTATNLGFAARLGFYTQTPTEGTRTTWLYNLSGWHPERSVQIPSNTQFGCVKFYKCTIWETDYYLLAAGISAGGQCSPTGNTMLMLIPTAYWEDKEVKPYVGPVTPESAAGFDPPDRTFYTDSILPTVLQDTDPFGLGSGSGGVHLVNQTKSMYQDFINGIFNGPSNPLTSTIGENLGLQKRDADIIQIMTQGVLSCKMMPKINIETTALCEKTTVCGYQLGGFGDWTQASVGAYIKQISPVDIDPVFISRTYNNFLDFEPYTTMSLHIPFLGDVAIDPSVVYNSWIGLQGYIDYFTGLLSLSVMIYRSETAPYIYTTLQGNCAVDIPIIGAGSGSIQAIGKIASGLGKVKANPINGVFGMLQGISQVGRSVPITHNTESSLAAMFSPRTVYLTINTPLPENPSNYAALMGTVVRKEGTVGKYTGYSEFSAVNLNTVNATDAEKEEIERLLKTGVFV